MANTILDCWDIMNNPTQEKFSGSNAAFRIYEYMTGDQWLSGANRGQTGHAFGQFVIDAWAAKNSKIRNDESVETQSLKDFRDNNL